MWQPNWREQLPELFAREWDLVIVGGGITGAGILLEAARRGLRALLVEQRDFAWGTSSRSSKLVHGGLRYIKEGKLLLTRDSVQERQNLLREAPGLVDTQSFAFADYAGRKPGRWMFAAGLAIYDIMQFVKCEVSTYCIGMAASMVKQKTAFPTALYFDFPSDNSTGLVVWYISVCQRPIAKMGTIHAASLA